ncbi:hypothetical protein [Paraburkholderia sp. A1RO-5L]|uniref:hypothetical protein n=1 Tax=unclassified Paraburkholderia TaxID=2615204 RepID=UPI003B7C015C
MLILTARALCLRMNITADTLAAWKAGGCPVHRIASRPHRADHYDVFAVTDWLRSTQRARDLANIPASLLRVMQHLRAVGAKQAHREA